MSEGSLFQYICGESEKDALHDPGHCAFGPSRRCRGRNARYKRDVIPYLVKLLSVCTPGYIVAESDGGLSNRLRTLVSHIYIGNVMHNNANVVFIWNTNDACPGHFLQIFQPCKSRIVFPSPHFLSHHLPAYML